MMPLMPPPSMLSTVTIFALVGGVGEGEGAVLHKHSCVVKSSINETRNMLVFCIASAV